MDRETQLNIGRNVGMGAKRQQLLIVSLSPVAESLPVFRKTGGLSGGDRILIELARHWEALFDIEILTWAGGRYLMEDVHGLRQVHYIAIPLRILQHGGMIILYLAKILQGMFRALTGRFETPDIIFTGSDFMPDVLPSLVLRRRFPRAKWVASLFLFCPPPWDRASPYRGLRRVTGAVYWATQAVLKRIIRAQADVVFVTSEPDVAYFVTARRPRERVVVIRGGVDIDGPRRVPEQPKVFDGVFIGRFHPQKGVLELIEIWRLVVNHLPTARLAVIGLGPLEEAMHRRVQETGLTEHVVFFGFLDGEEKYKIFKQARVVLHPATYDSGGMAACEAFACGLPGVSFDLEALKTYYPQGMVKTACFDLQQYADHVIRLLTDPEWYRRTAAQALDLAVKHWDWKRQAEQITARMKGD